MKKIIQAESKVLRQSAISVPVSKISSKEVAKIIKEMKEALDNEGDGVAIAAPQIGYSKRIFVVSSKAFEDNDSKNRELVYINPKITKLSKKKVPMNEGCLSVRWKYGSVERAKKATVEAYDEKGKKFSRGASGLLAQIFQHENDHLDGVLFIDKATDLVEYKPEEIKNGN